LTAREALTRLSVRLAALVELYREGASKALPGGMAQATLDAKAEAYGATLELVVRMLADLPEGS
jgi:hypothetical protein